MKILQNQLFLLLQLFSILYCFILSSLGSIKLKGHIPSINSSQSNKKIEWKKLF